MKLNILLAARTIVWFLIVRGAFLLIASLASDEARDRSSGAPLGDAQAEAVIFSLERPALFEIGLKAKK